MEKPLLIDAWHKEHLDSFAPPVCNKLMYKNQVSVMFVGGPNTREDFHLQAGAEFFYQLKGNMELPTIQQGKRKLVKISEGHVFLLPSRIPHSPQRPEAESLGLVIERERLNTASSKKEMDALRFYTDFETCNQKLWERNFYCSDLGKDLVPVITEWKASEESSTRTPKENSVPAEPAIVENDEVSVPDPFSLQDWIVRHQAKLEEEGASIPLFAEDHPDTEFVILMEGVTGPGSAEEWRKPSDESLETIVLQVRGTCTLYVDSGIQSADETQAESQEDGETKPPAKRQKTKETYTLEEGSIFVLGKGASFAMVRGKGDVTMVISQNPNGTGRQMYYSTNSLSSSLVDSFD